jgi:secreted trypsin-like serine protease
MFILPFVLLFLAFSQSDGQVEYLCSSTAPCGCSTEPALLTKIVGGEPAATNTWGWAVSLSINDTWLCGGSILSSSWVLTAAHCMAGMLPSEVYISAATNELYGAKQLRVASSVIVNPQFDSVLIENDIALIKVSPPFDMTDPSISQICLPAPTTEDFPPLNSTVCKLFYQ